jgi:hypothetical protein
VKVGMVSRFRHYNNLHKTQGRLRRLLSEFSFSTMRDVLEARGMLKKRTATTPAARVASA